jgi:hypothetical protein
MPFKFSVGQAVSYTPIGEKKAGLYRVTRQMPQEERAIDFGYRIKSEAEVFERIVLECHLSSIDDDRPSVHVPSATGAQTAVKIAIR